MTEAHITALWLPRMDSEMEKHRNTMMTIRRNEAVADRLCGDRINAATIPGLAPHKKTGMKALLSSPSLTRRHKVTCAKCGIALQDNAHPHPGCRVPG